MDDSIYMIIIAALFSLLIAEKVINGFNIRTLTKSVQENTSIEKFGDHLYSSIPGEAFKDFVGTVQGFTERLANAFPQGSDLDALTESIHGIAKKIDGVLPPENGPTQGEKVPESNRVLEIVSVTEKPAE